MRPTLNIQMESNMAVAGPSQTAGVSMPLAGPSQTAGVSNICANYEDLLADIHMQEMERFRNPVTAFSYRFKGQTKEEYIVGPVRADPKVIKGNLMTDRRPLSATICALFRDAVALLEGGQGSLNDIVEKLYESQFIKRTYGSKTAMKPKLVVALSSYIMPKLLVEDNPCVSINRISNGLSEKTIYSYKFLSNNKEDLEKIAEEDCKAKKKTVKRRKTLAALSDLDVNGKLPNNLPSTPSPVPTTAFPNKTLMASSLLHVGESRNTDENHE
ncbi:hypothetical protein DAPPUDRAFT_245814 [Daphnia pulex]|uniref:Nuclear factor related to kappa-B-binding protein second winged helix domain-containing protein n=1 Tax=Daphnia pulex TaxID=6669 RepID=E9GP43_DAPPU|nr:hypothetical protein DAPPUDRAFT_245814 [Daphnia pulex]|eukprot:EFX78577.1 hypothetical protein DAPPUDRAFT_245814 [Daphnia pulex]